MHNNVSNIDESGRLLCLYCILVKHFSNNLISFNTAFTLIHFIYLRYNKLDDLLPNAITELPPSRVMCFSLHVTSHHFSSHHIIPHPSLLITSHLIISFHITSHHIISFHITSHHITSHHITYLILHRSYYYSQDLSVKENPL